VAGAVSAAFRGEGAITSVYAFNASAVLLLIFVGLAVYFRVM
jgi:hypothetical protein